MLTFIDLVVTSISTVALVTGTSNAGCLLQGKVRENLEKSGKKIISGKVRENKGKISKTGKSQGKFL